MYSHLVVATDFSDVSNALIDRIDEFRGLGAGRITLVHVRDTGYPTSAATIEKSAYKNELRQLTQRLTDAGWDADRRYVAGRPASRIVDVATDVDADLIVLGNKGHGATAEVLIGSVATEVLERTKHPVFLFCQKAAQNDAPLIGDQIFHPTDFSETADYALSAAASIASPEQRSITLLNVYDEGGASKSDILRARRQKLEDRKRRLTTTGVSRVEIRLEPGRPRAVVVDQLEDSPGALCIIGTHGRGWFGDFVLGGVTRAVARRGTHHMLVVPRRPE